MDPEPLSRCGSAGHRLERPSARLPIRQAHGTRSPESNLPATPCLACHRSFFPLSYALENFDVLRRWRTGYGRDSIDASGMMVAGTTFNGPIELRRALLARQDAFLNTLTERLIAYCLDGTAALPTPASRMPAVRAVLREAAAHNYSWSSLLAAIAKAPLEQP
jgi:hypothetical protein